MNNNRYLVFGLLGFAILLVVIVIIIVVLLFRGDGASTTPTDQSPTLAPLPSGATAETIRVTSISPTNNQKNVDQNNSLFITFDKEIPQGIDISLSPTLSGTQRRDDNTKTLEFIPTTAFQPLTLYTVTLSIQKDPFVSPENTLASSYTWKFTTGEQQGESGFSQEAIQDMIRQRQEAEKQYEERKARLPFIISLPYRTNHFTIEILATSDTVTVTTFGTTQAEIDAYKQEARDWLTQNGAVFDRFTLRYENSNP